MTELGIGLVGCGRWGQLLANIVQELDGAYVAAVQNRSLATAQAFGDELGVTVHRTHQELTADPNVEAVLVVNPHSLHEEVTVAAAEAGKHIFVEKPLAIDLATCYRMLDAADKYAVKLMCGHVTRLYPVYARVAEIVRSGRLGRLSSINIADMVNLRRVNWWAKSETMGALLHSPGVHMIDFLLFVCGPATSIYAIETKVKVQTDVEYQDSLFMLIEFADGLIGGLECSVSCLTPGRQGNLVGTLGSLRYDPGESWIKVKTSQGEEEHIEVGPPDNNDRMDIGIRAELQSFIDWINTDAEPILTGWDGLQAVEIIEAAYQSVTQKQPVKLPLPRP